MSWNISVVNEEVVITLTIDDEAASTALAAAARAEAARDLAEADAVATAADLVQTGLDRVATGADRVQTGLDRVATAADRVQTGLDRIATAADRVQTGQDREAAAESALEAQSAAATAESARDQASGHRLNAQNAADAAEVSQLAAAQSATDALASQQAAETSEDNALASQQAAATSASNALASQQAAATSAINALASEQAASASEDNALISEQNAAASAAASEASRLQSDYSALQAGTSASVAQQAANNAVAVVTGGTASLTPQAGRIPIADANGKIDSGWIDPISGLNSAALHRSPNAVTAMFVYDTSKDSDGGAWTEKCQHTSWYNETMQGRWLGQQATEAAARAITGVTTGDYFQRTSDGRFYSLNAGSGITEVFRGNKRSFPKVAGLVAEAGNLTIYDLTESGNPMWMRFLNTGSNVSALGVLTGGTPNISSASALNSIVALGTNGGCALFDFAKDNTVGCRLVNQVFGLRNPSIFFRNNQSGAGILSNLLGYVIANNTINHIAMTYVQDAQVDAVTGLKNPTIAVATGGGLSIIQSNGVVRNSSATTALIRVQVSPSYVAAIRANTEVYYAKNPNTLGGSFALTTIAGTTELGAGANSSDIQSIGLSKVVRGLSSALVKLGNINIDNAARTLAAPIRNDSNAGYLVGDIRRAYLASNLLTALTGTVTDRSFRAIVANVIGSITRSAVATGADLVGHSGWSNANYLREPYSAELDFGTGEVHLSAWVNVPTTVPAIGRILSRAFSSGSAIMLSVNTNGTLFCEISDGTTTRTVTTPIAYNTAQWTKVEANYIAGRLSILINGVEVAATTGNPLLTLNNASAVLTIGNNFDLNAPFPGSLALVKLSATTPSAEQSLFMYEQEKQLFRANAKCVLPDANAISDLAYDEVTDQWIAVSSANESNWTGLVRNSVRTPSAGAFSRVESRGGYELVARTTTNIGVDVTTPSIGIRNNAITRAEVAARLSQDIGIFEFVGGFIVNTVNGNVAITSVANLSYPQSPVGARVSGSGIPANTTVVGISGTTIFLSAAATASASNVSISFLDYNLPSGFDATDVKIAGVTMREGATRDYIKLYDGFKQTIRFAVAPSATAWIQIICKKELI